MIPLPSIVHILMRNRTACSHCNRSIQSDQELDAPLLFYWLWKALNAEGNYTEEELESYMESHKKVMIDSLWKLNVVDIEGTLSRVCQMVLQDNNAKKEELRARAKGLKTLGKIFQQVKSETNEADTAIGAELYKLNGSESSYDPLASKTSPKSRGMEDQSYNGIATQIPYVVAPQFADASQCHISYPMPTAPPGVQRSYSTGKE